MQKTLNAKTQRGEAANPSKRRFATGVLRRFRVASASGGCVTTSSFFFKKTNAAMNHFAPARGRCYPAMAKSFLFIRAHRLNAGCNPAFRYGKDFVENAGFVGRALHTQKRKKVEGKWRDEAANPSERRFATGVLRRFRVASASGGCVTTSSFFFKKTNAAMNHFAPARGRCYPAMAKSFLFIRAHRLNAGCNPALPHGKDFFENAGFVGRALHRQKRKKVERKWRDEAANPSKRRFATGVLRRFRVASASGECVTTSSFFFKKTNAAMNHFAPARGRCYPAMAKSFLADGSYC